MSPLAAPAVAEVQGLYGPFSFAEKLLQKIWWRGDFEQAHAHLEDGRSVQIIHPGRWNLLGGPDFRDARVKLGEGPEVTGDVELHLHARDWLAHGHLRDVGYSKVVLHVVLFKPLAASTTTEGWRGIHIPILTLLPLLHHDLEEFAADEAVEVLAGQAESRVPEELATMPASELSQLLTSQADVRWQMKVRFAKIRSDKLGWENACHHAALEVLGYRFNRGGMLRIAGAYPLAHWATGSGIVENALSAESGRWRFSGVRPANYPRTRLLQYFKWCGEYPQWPVQLLEWGTRLPGLEAGHITRDARRVGGFSALRADLAENICGGALRGTRLDTLVCDACLPLLASRGGHPSAREIWRHWFPGDLPPRLVASLRRLAVFQEKKAPAAQGPVQGLLGWLLSRPARN